MTRKDLKDYRYNQEWINNQLERYKEQRTIVENITQNLDGMPKAQNKPNYALEELMDKYNEIINILNKDQEKQNLILKQLRLVEEPYRTILSERYIYGKTFEEISVKIHYAYDNTSRMHGIALNMFDKLDEHVKKCQDISTKNVLI